MKTLGIPFLLLSLLITGCAAVQPAAQAPTQSPPTARPSPSQTPAPQTALLPEGKVIFAESPTRKFTGTVSGQGPTVVLLANMSTGGETQWAPFVDALDKQKFTAITFNYLDTDYTVALQESYIILTTLREKGYKRVICMGASLGVTACGGLAREPEIVGLVLIAGPNRAGSLAKAAYPKLFIAGALDQWAQATQEIYDEAVEPKKLVLFEKNSLHGTNLFYSQDREEFRRLLLNFVDSLASP